MLLHAARLWLSLSDRVCRPLFYNTELPSVAQTVDDLAYGPESDQCLDITIPTGRPPFPVLILVHGGGWMTGDKLSYRRIAHEFAHAGYLTFNINYRLWPKCGLREQLQDVINALQWIQCHAAQYGGDPSSLVLAGDSAGANLISWYTAALRDPSLFTAAGLQMASAPWPVDALLLFYGVYDLRLLKSTNVSGVGRPLVDALVGGQSGAENNLDLYSPIHHLDKGFPPSFLCCGERDMLYSQSTAMAQALQDMELPHQFILLKSREHPEALHGFLNYHRRPAAKLAMQAALQFLRNLP